MDLIFCGVYLKKVIYLKLISNYKKNHMLRMDFEYVSDLQFAKFKHGKKNIK